MMSAPPLNYSVPGLVAFATVVLILSVCAIVLRFWSRLVTPGGLGYVMFPTLGTRVTDSIIAWMIGLR